MNVRDKSLLASFRAIVGRSRYGADNRVGLLLRDGEAMRCGVTTAELQASAAFLYAQIKSPLRESSPVFILSQACLRYGSRRLPFS